MSALTIAHGERRSGDPLLGRVARRGVVSSAVRSRPRRRSTSRSTGPTARPAPSTTASASDAPSGRTASRTPSAPTFDSAPGSTVMRTVSRRSGPATSPGWARIAAATRPSGVSARRGVQRQPEARHGEQVGGERRRPAAVDGDGVDGACEAFEGRPHPALQRVLGVEVALDRPPPRHAGGEHRGVLARAVHREPLGRPHAPRVVGGDPERARGRASERVGVEAVAREQPGGEGEVLGLAGVRAGGERQLAVVEIGGGPGQGLQHRHRLGRLERRARQHRDVHGPGPQRRRPVGLEHHQGDPVLGLDELAAGHLDHPGLGGTHTSRSASARACPARSSTCSRRGSASSPASAMFAPDQRRGALGGRGGEERGGHRVAGEVVGPALGQERRQLGDAHGEGDDVGGHLDDRLGRGGTSAGLAPRLEEAREGLDVVVGEAQGLGAQGVELSDGLPVGGGLRDLGGEPRGERGGHGGRRPRRGAGPGGGEDLPEPRDPQLTDRPAHGCAPGLCESFPPS